MGAYSGGYFYTVSMLRVRINSVRVVVDQSFLIKTRTQVKSWTNPERRYRAAVAPWGTQGVKGWGRQSHQ